MCCTAVPRIARPSDNQFIGYAKEGKTEQVAEALLHYPDLVHVKDKVSDLCYSDEYHFPSLCDCHLCVSPLDDICRHPSTLHHYPIISSSTVMIQPSFSDIYFVQEILTCTFIWYFHCIFLTDIISHCSSDILFSFFHNFHIFHFPTMRWPTSPLASVGPVPHRLHNRDTHLLYDLYPPVL